MPRARTIWRAVARVSRRSSMACALQSQTPLTSSTVLRSNSLCTRGFSPISAMTAVASLVRSRVCASTSANSHSTPTVGRGEPAKSIWARALFTDELAGTNDTTRHSLAGVTSGNRGLVGPGCPVALGVAVRRDIGEIVRTSVNEDRRPLPTEQVVLGERVGGGHQQRRTVLTDLQRGQVTALLAAGIPGRPIMPTGGQEIARCAAARGNRVGLALAHRVDVHAVKSRGELAQPGRLHSDGHKTVVELELGRRHAGAVRRLQMRGQALRRARPALRLRVRWPR